METEIIETVLTEMYQIDVENGNRLIAIEKKLESKDVAKPEINTQPIERIISSGIDEIRAMIDRRPEKVRREFRILLFPEHNTKEYYRIVFGRIIFWLIMLVIAKYAYVLGSEWITKEYESQKYKKAWENLYRHQEKANQKIMQRIISEQ